MLYKIGKMSKLLGISPEGLRLYERSGMISSIKNEDTGVRYYQPLDITSLIRCKSYRRYGFSINETADLMNTKDLAFITEQYKQREDILRDKIEWDIQMLSYLKGIRRIIETMGADFKHCKIAESPSMYRFVYMENGNIVLNDEMLEKFSNWVERVPFSALSIVWDKERLMRSETSYKAALCVPVEYAKAVGHYLGDPVLYLPPKKCVYSISCEDSDAFDVEQCLGYVLDYFKENRLSMTEDPYCRTFLSTDKSGNYTRWRQVWFPIE